MAASASRRGTSCQPSVKRSILSVGRDLHDVLGDHGLVLDIGDDRAHGRDGLVGRAGLFLGRLPQLVELLIGQEDAAAMLLEDLRSFS